MARKKTAKRSAKRQPFRNAVTTIEQMEKDFVKTPARLAGQLKKEITALKTKENKLKQALGKVNMNVKMSEKKLEDASSKRDTVALRKKYMKLKKSYHAYMKEHARLDKELQSATKSLNTLITHQAKLTALNKYIKQFDKEWLNKSKGIKKDKVGKSKTKMETVVEKPKEIISHQSTEPVYASQQPKYDDFVTRETITIEETEISS